jgi:hypothetical protein
LSPSSSTLFYLCILYFFFFLPWLLKKLLRLFLLRLGLVQKGPTASWISLLWRVARIINGGDVTLYERMFLAGLRLPFPEIARDFVLFLMVAPSQIMPNAWRYLFASYILWRLVLKKEMDILQFFNIYRPRQTSEGMIELLVQHREQKKPLG